MRSIFWANSSVGKIGTAHADGGAVNQALVTGVELPERMAIDSRYVYWADWTNRSIGRCKLDGTEPLPKWISIGGTSRPSGVAVDSGHVYWSDTEALKIGRAKLDGTGVEKEWLNSGACRSVVVDSAHVYWGAETAIGRAKLDGTGVEKEWVKIPAEGVALGGTYIYAANTGAKSIGRAKLDGTGVEKEWAKTSGTLEAVAVAGGYVYWGNRTENSVGRVAVDGSGLTNKWITGASDPRGIVSQPQEVIPVTGEVSSPTGVLAVGEVLRLPEGPWLSEPEGFTYQWQRYNEELEEWENIAGATKAEYELVEEDEGSEIRVVITALAEGGGAVVKSEGAGPIEGFVLGTLGEPHGFPDWQPWLARQPTPLYADDELLVKAETKLGPLYVGGAAAVNLLLKQTAKTGALGVTVYWHVGTSLVQPYAVQTFYLHPGEGELHQQVPSEADHMTIVLTPLAAGTEATYRILVQATESSVGERRLGADVLLSLAALEVAKESNTQKTLARTAPGRAVLTASATGEGAGRTLTFEQLNSKGEWVRYFGFVLPNASALTAVTFELPASPLRVTIGNTTAAATKVDLAIGVT